jgi:hypothetical protein
MMESIKTTGCLMLAIIASVLASCDAAVDDEPLHDIYLGLRIGDDTSTVTDTIARNRWILAWDLRSGREGSDPTSTQVYVPPSEIGEVSVTVDSGRVVALRRRWAFASADTSLAGRFRDSIRSILIITYPTRVKGIARHWLTATKPESLYTSLWTTCPNPYLDSCFVALSTVGGRSLLFDQ